MKKYGLIPAIVLIVLTNVVVLAGVVYNRSGEPDATMTLTERELHWRDSWRNVDREDSGLYLKLKINSSGYDRYNWKHREYALLNQEKLAELGFDTTFPLKGSMASRYYSRQLPRQAYVVLEFEGDAHQNWLQLQKKQIEKLKQELLEEKKPDKKKSLRNFIRQNEKSLISESHLFVVDAGQDASKLREQYTDRSRYIITPAVFRISLHYEPSKKNPHLLSKPYLSGWVQKLSIEEIHVPSDYRSFFISDIKTHTKTYLPKGKPLSDLKPRYRVTLNYGKRHEPWIADVKKLK